MQDFYKFRYKTNFGYWLNHTYGMSAKTSMVGEVHHPKSLVITYFKHGNGIIKIEGRHYDIREGDIYILEPSELFCCTVNDKTFHERITIHITEAFFGQFPCDCSGLSMPFYAREKGVSNLIPAEMVKQYGIDVEIEQLLTLSQSSEPVSSVLAICKVVEILSKLSQIVSSKPQIKNDQGHENLTIKEVLEYIGNHFCEDISVDDIASQFSLNKSYLSHLFKEYVGTSVWNYVIFRRINLFNDLMKKGHSIEETSRRIGFQNYSNFFRLYKKHMQMTPKEYKKQIKN